MNRLTKTLAGLGLALGLIALPLGAGAGTIESQTSHRIFTQEAVQRSQYDPMATYMMRDLSPLEQIAGKENLDWQTIQFLEDNLWDHDIIARATGTADSDAQDTCSEKIARLNPDSFSVEEYHFFEENVCGIESRARFLGREDNPDIGFYEDPPLAADWQDLYLNQQTGVDAIDLDLFSDEIPWQDAVDDVARFAETDAEPYYPRPEDVPQLRAGELIY